MIDRSILHERWSSFRVGKVRLPPLEQDSGKGRFVNTACDLKRWSSDFGARNGEFLKMGWTFSDADRPGRIGCARNLRYIGRNMKRSKFLYFVESELVSALFVCLCSTLIVWETGLSGLNDILQRVTVVFYRRKVAFCTRLVMDLCMWGRFDIDFCFAL